MTVDSFTPISAIAGDRILGGGGRGGTDGFSKKLEFYKIWVYYNIGQFKAMTATGNLNKRSKSYQGRGPWWLQKNTVSGSDSPDMPMSSLLAHLMYLDSLKELKTDQFSVYLLLCSMYNHMIPINTNMQQRGTSIGI